MLVVVIVFIFGNLKDCLMEILAPTTTNYILNPKLKYFGTKTRAEFKGSCLKLVKITYDEKNSKHIHYL